jgi:outer membrane protein assembly factor BamB
LLIACLVLDASTWADTLAATREATVVWRSPMPKSMDSGSRFERYASFADRFAWGMEPHYTNGLALGISSFSDGKELSRVEYPGGCRFVDATALRLVRSGPAATWLIHCSQSWSARSEPTDVLIAIDPQTLSERWKLTHGSHRFYPWPISEQTVMVVESERPFGRDREQGSAWLGAINVTDGKSQWRLPLFTDLDSPCGDADERDFFFCGARAFELSSGREHGVSSDEVQRRIHPTYDGFRFFSGGHVLVIGVGDEPSTVFDLATGNRITGIPLHHAGRFAFQWPWLFIVQEKETWPPRMNQGRLDAMDLSSGRRWTYERPVSASSEVVAGQANVYVCTDGGTVHAVELATGRMNWYAGVNDETRCRDLYVRPARGFDPESLLAFDDQGRLTSIDPSRPSPSRVTEISGQALPGVRVWVGDQMVRTDGGGRFRLALAGRADGLVKLQIDPRDEQRRCLEHAPAYLTLDGSRAQRVRFVASRRSCGCPGEAECDGDP